VTWKSIDANPTVRQCPSCGNPIPIGDACPHCGAGAPATIDQFKTASDHRFLQELFTRSNPFTMILIGINVGVFVLMSLAGGFAVTSVDPQVLLAFGAKQNTLIAQNHEYWRLITSIFIHIGIIHLFLNNYALWIIGQEIERIYGSARFVIIYLSTGVVGSLGSYYFNPEATSAGASGSIFGLFGVMAAFAFKYRKEIPEFLSRDIKRRIIPVIAINLIFGFSVKIVDNAAHIGGLLSGIALALAVPYMRPHERITPAIWRTLQVTCLALMLISFVDAFRSYSGPRLSMHNLTARTGSNVEAYFNNMRDASRSLSESFKIMVELPHAKDPSADVKRAADTIERGTGYLNSATRITSESEQYKARLLDLMNEQKDILAEYARTGSKAPGGFDNREGELLARYNQFLSDYGKWLPAFLKEHGYELSGGDRQP